MRYEIKLNEIQGRVICGNAFDLLDSLPNNCVDLILTDIPYGEVNRSSFGLRVLNKNKADIVDFSVKKLCNEFVRVCRGSIYIFCGIKQVSYLKHNFEKNGLSTRLCVWKKTNPSPMNGKRFWLSGIECCIFAKKKNAIFNEHCKNCVWEYSSGRSKVHPTEKPLELFKYLIRVSSNPNDIVLDTFLGSGTTAIACKDLRRRFIGSEINREYYDSIKKRFGLL